MITMTGRIAELRNEKSISAIALSQHLSFPRHAIERFESGRQTPNKEQQQKLANYFGVSVAFLRGETNDPTRQDSWMDMAYESDASPAPETQSDVRYLPKKQTGKRTETASESDPNWIAALLRSQAAQDIIRDIVRDEIKNQKE